MSTAGGRSGSSAVASSEGTSSVSLLQGAIADLVSILLYQNCYTVGPLLSSHFPKLRIICNLTVVFDTSIQWPSLLSDCGHLFAVARLLFTSFLSLLTKPPWKVRGPNG